MILSWLLDWQVTGAYPTEGISLNSWAREFLRRNSDYQEDFSRWKELGIDVDFLPASASDSMALAHCEPSALEEETYSEYDQRCAGYKLKPLSVHWAERYGVDYRHDPANSARYVRFVTGTSPTYLINHTGDPDGYGPMRPEKPGEVVVKLNLEWPVDTQLERLRRPLLAAQNNLKKDGLVVHDTRPQVRMYKNYLRLLDGESAGAKTNEMADALFPDVPEDYPERKRYMAASNGLKAAKRLRDGDYLFLLA